MPQQQNPYNPQPTQTPSAETPTQPSATQQETAQTIDETTKLEAQKLVTQAETILALTGVDVMKLYRENDQVRLKVLNHEWDFQDVYREAVQAGAVQTALPDASSPFAAQPAVFHPQVVRAANGAHTAPADVKSMTDEQFAQLNKQLAKGRTIAL